MVSQSGHCQFLVETENAASFTDQWLICAICVEKEIQVVNYNKTAEQTINNGNSVEVRGVVTGKSKLQFSDLNKFEGDFDMSSYEQMLEYYHGLCKHLCVTSN